MHFGKIMWEDESVSCCSVQVRDTPSWHPTRADPFPLVLAEFRPHPPGSCYHRKYTCRALRIQGLTACISHGSDVGREIKVDAVKLLHFW